MSSRFLNELKATPYPDGVTWYLLSDLKYESESHGSIVIPKGFETDFASVPAVVQNVLPRWGTYGTASVVHDWLYWNQQLSREESDKVFNEAMIATSVVLWKRVTLYNAVRWFGEWAWNSNHAIAVQGFSRVRGAQSPATPMWSRADSDVTVVST